MAANKNPAEKIPAEKIPAEKIPAEKNSRGRNPTGKNAAAFFAAREKCRVKIFPRKNFPQQKVLRRKFAAIVRGSENLQQLSEHVCFFS